MTTINTYNNKTDQTKLKGDQKRTSGSSKRAERRPTNVKQKYDLSSI